jgi:hypothetical protein
VARCRVRLRAQAKQPAQFKCLFFNCCFLLLKNDKSLVSSHQIDPLPFFCSNILLSMQTHFIRLHCLFEEPAQVKRGLRRLGSQRSARSQPRVVDGYHREQRPLDAKRFVPVRISWSRWSIWSCLAFNINFPRQLLYYSISSFALQVVIISSSLLKQRCPGQRSS